MDIFIDRPLNTSAQAFRYVPLIYNNAPEEIDYITGEKWNPQQDPYFLLLPCQHMVKKSYHSLSRLKGDLEWICPRCQTPIQNIVEYPSTPEMMYLSQHNKTFSTINHPRNSTDHPKGESMVNLRPTSQPRPFPLSTTLSFPHPQSMQRVNAPSTLPSVHEELTLDAPSTSLLIPESGWFFSHGPKLTKRNVVATYPILKEQGWF